MEKLHLQGTSFVTDDGREVILHGVNVLARERTNHHFYPNFENAFPWFRHMGFNLLRFGIFWDAAEPQPGVIDEDYLAHVKEYVNLAARYDIYVMIDMHQDLFAQKFIDGAPDWTCLDEGLPHPNDCNIWYEAYLKSEAIIRAADNFWANKPAEDGVGLLDHYEAMWERIAAVFADCPNVIGLEPMNEPFMGSLAREAFGAATMAMMQKNPQFDLARPDLISPEENIEFMRIVSEKLVHFDQTTLMDFYRRIQRAIQKTSDLAIITGGNIYCSTDVPTGIERLPGIGQIYAPHGYDSVVDSDRYDAYSTENVARVFAGKRQSQERLGLPTIVGEWGAFPSKPFTNDLIRFMNRILEENLWGSAYCEYRPGMEKDGNFIALRRAYPVKTGGKLISYCDSQNRDVDHNTAEAVSNGTEIRFEMTFDGKAGLETEIYLPFALIEISCSLPCKTDVADNGEDGCVCTVTSSEDGRQQICIR